MLWDLAFSLITSGAFLGNIRKQATNISYIIFKNSSFVIIFASLMVLCNSSNSCNVVTL
jgi:hypothetical protein